MDELTESPVTKEETQGLCRYHLTSFTGFHSMLTRTIFFVFLHRLLCERLAV